MSIKDVPFSIVQPATEDDTSFLGQVISNWIKLIQILIVWMMQKKSPKVLYFSRSIVHWEHIFFKLTNATILNVYTISHCMEVARLTFFLIQYLVKLKVCCITNSKVIHGKKIYCQFWKVLRNLPTIYLSHQPHKQQKLSDLWIQWSSTANHVYFTCIIDSRKKIWRQWNRSCHNWHTCVDLL